MPERKSLADDSAREPAALPGGRPGERREISGALGPAGILGLQRAAGNQATAALVQRKVETPGGIIGKLQPHIGNEVILGMAALAINNPVHRKCVFHYGRARGAPLKLDRNDLRAMNIQFNLFAWPEVKAAMKLADQKLHDQHRDPDLEKAGRPPIPPGVEESAPVVASGGAIGNGSIAGCTAHVDGKVIANSSGVRFEGMVHITDRWDFDPAWLTPDPKNRTWMGEAQTIVGWAILPGEPFLIDTETVPVTQVPGTERAQLQL